MQLNPSQEQAKNQINGPILILAGAGSGKTATLTSRIEYMIGTGINPSSILAVTFTNKASKEMKERISKKLNIQYQINQYKNQNLPFVGTFHSLGIFILKNHIEAIDMNKNFVIYDESDKLSIIKSIIKDELGLDEKKYIPRSIASFISNAKNALILAKDYEKYVDSHIKEIVNKVYLSYQNKLLENNALDFDDILVKTLEVLKNDEVLNYYQEKWKYLMIDEYQDTNAPQYEIVKLLASKYRNLAVVGDDSQSIYSWRGADMRNILNFKKDYPDALEIKLEQNYRSTQNIINAANEVISKNTIGIKKTLFTTNSIGESITYIDAPSDRIESQTIAKIIKKSANDLNESYAKNLILYRTNSQSRSIEEALMMEGIPYKVIGGLKFYDRKEIKDLIAYLKVIHNPNDVVSIKRIINTPSRKIGPTTLKKLDDYRDEFGVTYLQIFENISEVDELNSGAQNAIKKFYEILLDLMENSKIKEVSSLLDYIIQKIGYDEYLKDDTTPDEYEARLENIKELQNVLSTYNGLDPRESLSTALDEILLLTDFDKKEENSNNYVTLMTIHTSKGLEYDRVFITGLEEGLFPSFRSMELKDLEEERRLMYVAMTRAKEELYISRAGERFQFGNYVTNPESRFVKEIDTKYIKNYEFEIKNNFFTNSFSIKDHVENPFRVKKSLIENDVDNFEIGDRVSHPKFGFGSIISKSGDLAEIKFQTSGIKKMNIKIAPVKKI
ncbi:UvrD-helicase domain-containing protein [Candidatus Gracilibacteria bacterium]|nr:UvrD-helicase domain-containing protein [Candidatus Gracilibacteria bacterium]